MTNQEIKLDQLSPEEKRKADLLMEAEYILQQVAHGQISLNDGYDQFIKLVGPKIAKTIS